MNKYVEINIHESVTDPCLGCQTEEGRELIGSSTHKSIPVDTHNVKSVFLDDSSEPLWGQLCADCLVQAKIDGCHLKKDGKAWDGAGMGVFLRYTPEDINRIFSIGDKWKMTTNWKRPTFREIIGKRTETSEIVFKGKEGSVHVTLVSNPTNQKQLNTVKVEMKGNEPELYEQTVQSWKDKKYKVVSE